MPLRPLWPARGNKSDTEEDVYVTLQKFFEQEAITRARSPGEDSLVASEWTVTVGVFGFP